MLKVYSRFGDKIKGERIIAIYQDFQPKNGYRKASDGSGRNEMTLTKSVECYIEKPIKLSQG